MILLLLLTAALGVMAEIGDSLAEKGLRKRQGSYYWSNWSDGGEKVSCKNGAGGAYSITWSGTKGNFVCGKGWNPGSLSRVINYTATFNTDGNSYLAIYGWMTNPLVEYYVIENYGTHHPFDNPEAQLKGNMSSDGGDYEMMTKMRVNKPSIQGTATFAQYWAVRKEKRSGGTVTMKNFFDAWKAAGLKLGTQNYMLVAIEGQGSNGNATVTLGVLPPAQPTATGMP